MLLARQLPRHAFTSLLVGTLFTYHLWTIHLIMRIIPLTCIDGPRPRTPADRLSTPLATTSVSAIAASFLKFQGRAMLSHDAASFQRYAVISLSPDCSRLTWQHAMIASAKQELGQERVVNDADFTVYFTPMPCSIFAAKRHAAAPALAADAEQAAFISAAIYFTSCCTARKRDEYDQRQADMPAKGHRYTFHAAIYHAQPTILLRTCSSPAHTAWRRRLMPRARDDALLTPIICHAVSFIF